MEIAFHLIKFSRRVECNDVRIDQVVTLRQVVEHGLNVRGLGKDKGNETPPQNPANLYRSGVTQKSIENIFGMQYKFKAKGSTVLDK